MYPNYNMFNNNKNIYRNSNNDRFFGTGAIAPLLIGGIAGYAIGNNGFNNNNCCRPIYYQPYYYPYPNYNYNNFYY